MSEGLQSRQSLSRAWAQTPGVLGKSSKKKKKKEKITEIWTACLRAVKWLPCPAPSLRNHKQDIKEGSESQKNKSQEREKQETRGTPEIKVVVLAKTHGWLRLRLNREPLSNLLPLVQRPLERP